MDLRKDTDRVIAACKYSSFRYMISFFINILCSGAFRAIAHQSERFKFIAVRFYNIAVVDMDDQLGRAPIFHLQQISFQSIPGNPFGEMSGKAVNDVNLSGRFM